MKLPCTRAAITLACLAAPTLPATALVSTKVAPPPSMAAGGSADSLTLKGSPLLGLLNGGVRAQRAGTAGGPVKNLAEFGTLDPTGVADMAPIFNAAIASVPAGSHITIVVPNTTGSDKFDLGSVVSNNNRDVDIDLTSGAGVGSNFGGTGSGILYVNRVRQTTNDFFDEQIQGGGSPGGGVPIFARRIVSNNGGNAAMGESYNYISYNAASANQNGDDIGYYNIASWPNLRDGTGMLARWYVAVSPFLNAADIAAGAHGSMGAVEINPVNEGPEPTFTEYDSALSGAGQGAPLWSTNGILLQPDRWDPSGSYGGSGQFAYGCFPHPLLNKRPSVWAAGTSYAAGTYVLANGNVYTDPTGGTSAGSGTGPSGTGSGIADGTVTWTYVGSGAHIPTSATGPYQPGWASCFHVGNDAVIPGGHAIYLGGRKSGSVMLQPGAAILAHYKWQTLIDTTGATFQNGVAIKLGSGQGFKFTPVPVANLPACTSAVADVMMTVSDATTLSYGASPSGGGSKHTPVYCDGISWSIH